MLQKIVQWFQFLNVRNAENLSTTKRTNLEEQGWKGSDGILF